MFLSTQFISLILRLDSDFDVIYAVTDGLTDAAIAVNIAAKAVMVGASTIIILFYFILSQRS